MMMAVSAPVARQRAKPATEGYWLIAGPPGSPLGHIYLEYSARGIASVELAIEELPVQPRQDQPILSENHRLASRHPWARELIATLRAYLQGERVSFDIFPRDLAGQSPFRRLVLEECRKVPYGETTTYAELAARAGNAAAIRAAASAMSHNPLPLIIPCHRVLRSDGTIGGYSGPGGVALKMSLLELERRVSRA